ncbi:MAG: hypothetical protein QOD40_907 [Alphaproteobacteria bacterium]|nr:hypothetical protein [Alphaproteobacteria bacterium]
MTRGARVLLVLCCAAFTSSAYAACEVTITFNDVTVPQEARSWLEQELKKAAEKVCAWWGPTFSGPLTIDINNSTEAAMSLVPSWRGKSNYIVFPARTALQSSAATIHEMTHIFAPNANRFLAEGLAVHVHDHLGGPPAFPNFGRPLHAAAKAFAQKADIAALDHLPTPNMLQLGGQLARKEAYLVGGSFVRFLIEQHGMEKFRQLYATTPFVPRQRNAGDPERWQQVYGMSLDEVASEWRKRVAGI